MLGGCADWSSSSSDHSSIAVLHGRAVRSSPSEMPLDLCVVELAGFLLFWTGSSTVGLFLWIFSDTGDGLSDEVLDSSSSGCSGRRMSTPFGQSALGTLEKYIALSCEWIFI